MFGLYKINEIASMFGVHYQTVRNWIQSGEIKATRIGNQYFITQEEVDRLKSGKKEV